MRFDPWFLVVLRGYDAAVNPKGEEAIAAQGATIGRSAKQAKQPGERAHPMFA